MLPLVWHPKASAALRDINEYIAARNPPAAARLIALIEAAAERIRRHPEMYRSGRIDSTREVVVHPNYVIVYRITGVVEILTIYHARQQYP